MVVEIVGGSWPFVEGVVDRAQAMFKFPAGEAYCAIVALPVVATKKNCPAGGGVSVTGVT